MFHSQSGLENTLRMGRLCRGGTEGVQCCLNGGGEVETFTSHHEGMNESRIFRKWEVSRSYFVNISDELICGIGAEDNRSDD